MDRVDAAAVVAMIRLRSTRPVWAGLIRIVLPAVVADADGAAAVGKPDAGCTKKEERVSPYEAE